MKDTRLKDAEQEIKRLKNILLAYNYCPDCETQFPGAFQLSHHRNHKSACVENKKFKKEHGIDGAGVEGKKFRAKYNIKMK